MKTRCIETTSRVIEHNTYRIYRIAKFSTLFYNLELFKCFIYSLNVNFRTMSIKGRLKRSIQRIFLGDLVIDTEEYIKKIVDVL